jgi:hypothetical protein
MAKLANIRGVKRYRSPSFQENFSKVSANVRKSAEDARKKREQQFTEISKINTRF